MTVRDLLAALEGVNPDAIVVLSRDEEGNGFSTLASRDPVSVGHYDAHVPWCREFESAPESMRATAPAVCLFPED